MSHPYMPFYVADYLSATGHLTAAEHGAYVLLILHYWQKRALPDDDGKLARIARLSDKEWRKAKPTIAEFFEDGWRHDRVEAELAKADEKHLKRSGAGKAGGIAKANNAANAKQKPSNASSELDEIGSKEGSKTLPSSSELDLGSSLRLEPREPAKDDWPDDWLECVLGELKAHPISRGVGGLDAGPLIALREEGIRWASVVSGVMSAAAKAENPIKSTRSLTNWITNAERDVRRARDAAGALPPKPEAPPAVLVADEARWKLRLDELRQGSPWRDQWGPSIGKPGCLVPKPLADEYIAWCRARKIEVAA